MVYSTYIYVYRILTIVYKPTYNGHHLVLASKHKHVTGRKTDSPARLCFQAMAGVVWSTPAARTVRQARSGRSAEEWPS